MLRFQPTLKRIADVAGAGFLLILLSPVLALAAAAIGLTMGRPVLFRQSRGGWKGRPFLICKFRTMTDDRDALGRPRADCDRLTRLGRFLRRTSIDELPQLWNVLKGEMSLVGPRPLLASYLDRYDEFQRRRHLVKPGITGWAQIRGRNSISWDERFELDAWYAEHWTLRLDFAILVRTTSKVLRRESTDSSEGTPMPEFLGSQDGCRG